MIPVAPPLIPEPFATNGTKNDIPAQSPGASEPNASWNLGFPPITMINRKAGGKPPLGADFNGILNALSQHAFFTQSGCVFPWQGSSGQFPGLNYLVGAHVLGSDMKEYIAVQPSGPDIPASGGGYVGPKNPATDTAHAYWQPAVTAGDLPEFDGTTIKEINGKLGVPQFTAPTASAPGKAGLVPAPAATPANDIPQFFLGKDAVWRELAEAGFGIDFATLDKNRIVWGVQTLIGDHDPDTITSGVYFLNSNSLVPSPYNGLLMTFVERQSNDSPLYALIQIFFTYLNSYYRTVTEPIRMGEAPTASQWGPWVSLCAPHPTTADSLGQWIGINSGMGTNMITLPAGGAWAYFLLGENASFQTTENRVSVSAGGTTISLIAGTTRVFGLAYRVM